MAKNTNLHAAKKNKNDEFYTRREDIEAELQHYREHFRGKTVYCNCDDPRESEFVRFFCRVFEDWELRKVIATHYEPDEQTCSYAISIDGDRNGDGKITPDDLVETPLSCNGDFRHPECVKLLQEADIVVTNPPFSLFREYVAQLVEYDKKFLIVGNINAVTYKEFFPLLKDGKVWAGYRFNKTMTFGVPESYYAKKDIGRDENGHKLVKVPGIAWYTNLDIPKRHSPIDLRGNRYYGNEDRYPKYANYDAIEVSKVAEIPEDYVPCWFDCDLAGDCPYAQSEGLKDDALCEAACNGEMGVPITYIDKHTSEQFDVLGASAELAHTTDEIRIATEGKRTGSDAFLMFENAGGGHPCRDVSTIGSSSGEEKVQRSDGGTDHVLRQVQPGSIRGSRQLQQQQYNPKEKRGLCTKQRYANIDKWDPEDVEWPGSRTNAPIQTHCYTTFRKCGGLIGVPITFLDKHCEEQFEIIGGFNGSRISEKRKYGYVESWDVPTVINGKEQLWNGPVIGKTPKYYRVIVRRRKQETRMGGGCAAAS